MRLITERLILRPLRVGDESDVLAYRGRADVCRYLEESPFTAATIGPFVSARTSATRIAGDGDRVLLAVELDGRVIGEVRLKVASLRNRSGEIGWVFHPAHHGRGYATEAAHYLVGFGFGELGLHRVWAQVDRRNVASARVCERLGMRLEGVLRESLRLDGEWADQEVYGVLEREWHPDPAASPSRPEHLIAADRRSD
ncbi:GNAT family N-acetyltransferase [Asanoa siamensis]|uniref:N-acetyltransferase n=1 Tax=Asanoa siamensis TaxID=926357 RepID=A0ABQ4CIN2_9ACTN|nr:GNAT family protein [Asanoa siamensis]GIF71155.1 N-acetyltransferase [Asanoa siamensis]